MGRSRNYQMYAFTCNNPTDETVEWLHSHVEPRTSWIIWGRETAPQTGTPHLQGALWMTNPTKPANIKRTFKDYWAERCTSPVKHADYWRAYCTKEDADAYEHGTPPTVEAYLESIKAAGQGTRTDQEEFIAAVQQAKPTREEELANPLYMRYPRYVKEVVSHYHPKLTKPRYDEKRWPMEEDIKSLVLIGESQIGKTEFAKQHFPNGCLFVSHIDQLKDFNANKHQGIVFDDMTFVHMPATAQIHLVDFDNDREIHLRYVTAEIPAGTPKIFTINPENLPIFADQPAINKRIKTRYLA